MKLVNINQLAEMTGLSPRTIRTLKDERKIPFIRLGHRTVVFQPEKVIPALERLEIKAVS